METMNVLWPQVGTFLKELTNYGVDADTLKVAVETALASVNSGYYSDPRLVPYEKIIRFRETVMAVCFTNNIAALRKARELIHQQPCIGFTGVDCV